jgi:hypothetical protein
VYDSWENYMAKKSYSEKLKDPRWQKKRLEILQRDGFNCCICGDENSTLHVHHRYYINGRDPWDYDDNILTTLCDGCHTFEHECEYSANNLINILKYSGFYNSDIEELAKVFLQIRTPYPKEVFVAALSKIFTNDVHTHEFMKIYFAIIKDENIEAING